MSGRMTEAEARNQIDTIKTFLQIAKTMLEHVDIQAIDREIKHFDSFAPFFDPTSWMSGRSANRDLKKWVDAIRPLKAALSDVSEAGAK